MKGKHLLITAPLVILFTCMYCWKYRQSLKHIMPIRLPEVRIELRQGNHAPIAFREKVWLHRVNSVERIKRTQDKYEGLEIDVSYNQKDGCFDVHHISVPSENLCLETLLENIKKPSGHYYWLDFKNLDSSNVIASLSALESISKKYQIRRKIVVEAGSPELLTFFTEKGYYTSYYIPDFDPYNEDSASIIKHAREIAARINSGKVCAVSGYFYQYPFLTRYFSGKDILVWHINEDPLNIFEFMMRRKLMNNNQVKVILTHEKTEGYK
jgi:hypothetical protein